jgi:hypothetical protein
MIKDDFLTYAYYVNFLKSNKTPADDERIRSYGTGVMKLLLTQFNEPGIVCPCCLVRHHVMKTYGEVEFRSAHS